MFHNLICALPANEADGGKCQERRAKEMTSDDVFYDHSDILLLGTLPVLDAVYSIPDTLGTLGILGTLYTVL